MTIRVETLPMFGYRPLSRGMDEIRRNLGQRSQNEVMRQDIATGQPQWRLAIDQVTIEQQINIERS